MDKRIFPANDVDPNRPGGWIADLSGPKAVNPDAYFRFSTRARAKQFVSRVDAGEDASQVYAEMIEQSKYAATLGRIGGSATTRAKRLASAANGKRGGRPRKTK